jgi:hypothetical protein
VAGKGKQRTTFAKLQKERARQEKQQAKRARRQSTPSEHDPFTPPPLGVSRPESSIGSFASEG